ncbi:MAG: sugar phosphate isomerase/epimerase [Clostridia bacterium]|nr:sugar phosphate isomerase/epimerase [Clostridia bacterium]
MADVKLGIQLFTLRDSIQTAEDFDKTLAELKNEGVSIIQISAIGPIPQTEVKEIVEKYGMDVCVTHTNFDRMKAETQTVIDEHKMINCDCLGLGAMGDDYRKDLASVRQFIKDAEAVGKMCYEQGCRFAYHNHDFEFKTVLEDGRTIMDVLLEETNPDYFWFIPDTAWIQIGGKDPVEFLEKLRGRVKVCHFKDYIKADTERGFKFTELGKGEVDIPACLEKLREMGVPYAVYEHDIDWEVSAMQSCKDSYKYMLKIAEK